MCNSINYFLQSCINQHKVSYLVLLLIYIHKVMCDFTKLKGEAIRPGSWEQVRHLCIRAVSPLIRMGVMGTARLSFGRFVTQWKSVHTWDQWGSCQSLNVLYSILINYPIFRYAGLLDKLLLQKYLPFIHLLFMINGHRTHTNEILLPLPLLRVHQKGHS